MPGPLARLLRQPTRTLAIVLLAVTTLASAGIQSAAAAALQATVNANWRGAYDILVSPKDAMKPIDGLLAPNTLASTQEGMSFSDLAKVRKVAGVDVAAPLGEVLVPDMQTGSPSLTIPVSVIARARTSPQAYTVQETYTTDDGLGERMVASDRFNLVIDDSSVPTEDQLANCMAQTHSTMNGRHGNYDIDPTKYPLLMRSTCKTILGGGQITVTDSQHPEAASVGTPILDDSKPVEVTLPDSLQTVTRITLVDPVAEKKLLGDKGAFLDPLMTVAPSGATGVSAMQRWAGADASSYATAFQQYLARSSGGSDMSPGELAETRALFTANGDDYDAFIAGMNDAMRYVPLLVSHQPVAGLSVKLDIASFGSVPAPSEDGFGPRVYTLPTGMKQSIGGSSVGTTAGNVSGLLNPFVASASALSWPGTTSGGSSSLTASANGLLSEVSSPLPASYVSGSNGLDLEPNGYRTPAATLDSGLDPATAVSTNADPKAIGAEAVYNGGTTPNKGRTSVSATLSVPVGAFDPEPIERADTASYVPLGAYGSVSSTLTSGPHAGTTLQPSISGMGLVSSRTAAVASIASASTWGDASPIDAIRVRVAGITSYSPQARQKVIDVAKHLQRLGFDTTIVAGSSPSATAVTVTGYAFGTANPAGKQHVGTLGTVTQNWSELGAASRVSLSVSTGTLAILGIGLVSGMLMLGASLLIGIPIRREQSATMRLVGFTRPRIFRWHAAEEAPALIMTALVGVTAVALSGASGETLVTVAVALAATFAASLASVFAGSRGRTNGREKDARSRRLGARSVAAFGARQALAHPLPSALGGAAYLTVGLAVSAIAAVILTTHEAAGHSSLATLTLGRMLAPQLLLGLAGIIGGILLARLIRRIEVARRSDQWALLRASGWTKRNVATAQRVEVFAIALPAVLLSAGGAWGASIWFGIASPWWAIAVATVAASMTAILTAAVRMKGVPR